MTNTTIYIDVDGVINSFHRSKTIGWEGEWQLATVLGYKIHWYTDLVEEINKLATMENVTVKWLTTWQDKAVTDLCPALGIEGTSWDVLYASDQEDLFNLSNGWWKLRAIIKDYTENKPDKMVWIDDDIKYEGNALGWIDFLGPDVILPISPFTDWGLTKENLDDIVAFATSETTKETNDES